MCCLMFANGEILTSQSNEQRLVFVQEQMKKIIRTYHFFLFNQQSLYILSDAVNRLEFLKFPATSNFQFTPYI